MWIAYLRAGQSLIREEIQDWSIKTLEALSLKHHYVVGRKCLGVMLVMLSRYVLKTFFTTLIICWIVDQELRRLMGRLELEDRLVHLSLMFCRYQPRCNSPRLRVPAYKFPPTVLACSIHNIQDVSPAIDSSWTISAHAMECLRVGCYLTYSIMFVHQWNAWSSIGSLLHTRNAAMYARRCIIDQASNELYTVDKDTRNDACVLLQSSN